MPLKGRAVGGDHDAGAVPVAALQVVQHGVGHAVQTVARLLVVGAERFDLTRFGVESSTHTRPCLFLWHSSLRPNAVRGSCASSDQTCAVPFPGSFSDGPCASSSFGFI